MGYIAEQTTSLDTSGWSQQVGISGEFTIIGPLPKQPLWRRLLWWWKRRLRKLTTFHVECPACGEDIEVRPLCLLRLPKSTILPQRNRNGIPKRRKSLSSKSG